MSLLGVNVSIFMEHSKSENVHIQLSEHHRYFTGIAKPKQGWVGYIFFVTGGNFMGVYLRTTSLHVVVIAFVSFSSSMSSFAPSSAVTSSSSAFISASVSKNREGASR